MNRFVDFPPFLRPVGGWLFIGQTSFFQSVIVFIHQIIYIFIYRKLIRSARGLYTRGLAQCVGMCAYIDRGKSY